MCVWVHVCVCVFICVVEAKGQLRCCFMGIFFLSHSSSLGWGSPNRQGWLGSEHSASRALGSQHALQLTPSFPFLLMQVLEIKCRSLGFQGECFTERFVFSVSVITLPSNFGVSGRCRGPCVCQVTLTCLSGHSNYHGLPCYMKKLQSKRWGICSNARKWENQDTKPTRSRFLTCLLYRRVKGWMNTLGGIWQQPKQGRGSGSLCLCLVRLVLGTRTKQLSSQDGNELGRRGKLACLHSV